MFVDEVDKIRSQVGRQPNVAGIRAQEALLTLIENESVPFRLPDWAGGATVNVDSSGLLFVCAGAFEGLYDAVYYRVTAGKDQGALKPVTVVDEDGRAREELQFSLRDWLKTEDLFEYGVSPQFLSRFDAVVLLEPLGEEALMKIFAEGGESGLRQSQAYFSSFGCRLEITQDAAQRIVLRGGAPAAPRRPRAQGGLPADRGPARVRPPRGGGGQGRRPHRPRAGEAGPRPRPQGRLRLHRLRLGPELRRLTRGRAAGRAVALA